MASGWERECSLLRAFSEDLDAGPTLPDATSEQLSRHARAVDDLQNLLGLVAGLPPRDRPPAAEWDDILGPLWRRLFEKGDDIVRYVLADLWRGVLLEAGETERYIRSCTAVAASARNASRFGEALACCRDARRAAEGRPSAALGNLLNTEGTVHVLLKDYESAEVSFREALSRAEAMPEEELLRHSGLGKEDYRAQEFLNILECRLLRALAHPGEERGRWVDSAREMFSLFERAPPNAAFERTLEVDRAELAIAEGRLAEARRLLELQMEDSSIRGPYRCSFQPMICRLLSLTASLEGDWRGAYRWVRSALRMGVNHNFPAEDQFVL